MEATKKSSKQEDMIKSKKQDEQQEKLKATLLKEMRESYLIVTGINAEIEKIANEANAKINELKEEAAYYIAKNTESTNKYNELQAKIK